MQIKLTRQMGSLEKWLWKLITIFLLLVTLCAVFFLLQAYIYKDRIFPGVKVGAVDLGGKTIKQAEVLLQAEADYLADQGLTVSYQQDNYKLKPVVALEENGQAYELWFYKIKATALEAYNYGRNGSLFKQAADRCLAEISGKEIDPVMKINQEKIIEILQAYFNKYEQQPQEARLAWRGGYFTVETEKPGQVFDYQQALEKIEQQLILMGRERQPLKLVLKSKQPVLTRGEVELLKNDAKQKLVLAPLKLKFEVPTYYQGRPYKKAKVWWIGKVKLAGWLKVKKDKQSGVLYIGLDQVAVKDYLSELAKEINQPAKDARFVVKDGRVVEWQSSQDGFLLDIAQTGARLEKVIKSGVKQDVELVLNKDSSKISNEKVNHLGIRELIGVGTSNFKGSPRNRRHNIKVGAEALNGLLIKPKEEFSLLKALGEINAENGYLPELVIKEGRTIPEYGGGLCQIGTTLFRAVINSGLPVTQRRNHSYRVSYYEPAGTDATIYDPWPDFKFVNDTGTYLLLQTRIEGDQAIFEFWGTSDGRQVSTTTPVIYNIVPPGEPEYIQTDELAPGEKKKIESAHAGADAYFKRIIVWPEEDNKETKEEIWRSHYIPWREKWLVGMEKASTTQPVTDPAE